MLAAQPCRSLVHALGVRKSWTDQPRLARSRLLCRMAVARANAAAPAHCRIRSDFVGPVWKLVWGGPPRPPFGRDAYLRAASRNALFRTRQSVGIFVTPIKDSHVGTMYKHRQPRA